MPYDIKRCMYCNRQIEDGIHGRSTACKALVVSTCLRVRVTAYGYASRACDIDTVQHRKVHTLQPPSMRRDRNPRLHFLPYHGTICNVCNAARLCSFQPTNIELLMHAIYVPCCPAVARPAYREGPLP